MSDILIEYLSITLLSSLIFVPKNSKKLFYLYFLSVTISIVILDSYLYFELFICPSFRAKLGFMLIAPFIIILNIFVIQRVKSTLKNNLEVYGKEDSLIFYITQRLTHKPFLKIIKLIFVTFFLFQVLLLYSANRAYVEAIKIGVKGIEKKNMLDFYDPFVKEIYIDESTRWSYHRECYVNE